MASEDYLPLFWKARREHLGNIARVSKEIIKLYREAAADLAARAAASREGSLSERWASEYARSLEQRVKELEAGLYDVTLQGLKRSAELPASAMGQWWEMVGGQSFRDAFATTPDSVLAGLIEGGFYRDRKGLSERIWRVAQGFEKDVGYIVQRGIAEKKSVAELAADLEQYVKPPAKRDFDWGKVYPNLSGKKVDFNAQRLARTSINHAYFLDNVKVCTENPFVESMHWDLSNAHEERQVIPFGPDECDEYAEHDEGLGLGNFKPEEIPVPHPQCLCVQWAVIPDSLEDIGARIGAWASGEPDELLDEWYDKYGNRNPNGDPKEILREGLKFEGNGGIIKEKSPRKSKHGNFDVDWNVVQSDAYRKRLEILSDNPKVVDSIQTHIIWALSNRTGTKTEELYALSLVDGHEIARISDQYFDYGVKRTPQFTRKVDEADRLGERILFIHNHPRGLPPSLGDINVLLDNTNVRGITAGHNGSLYFYSRPEKEVSEKDYYVSIEHFKAYSEVTSMEKALEQCSQLYGFDYYKL